MAITKIGTPELFDFSATNTALQLPTGDTASRPATPSTGEWRFNSQLKYVEYYDGGAWRQIDTESAAVFTPLGNFNTNTYFGNGGTQKIDAKFNEAANFNGTSSKILTSTRPLDGKTSLSISFWAKNISVTDYSSLMGEGVDSLTAGYKIQIKNTNDGNLALARSGGGGNYIIPDTNYFDFGVDGSDWVHVGFTVSPTQMIYYKNGVNVGQYSISNTATTTSAYTFHMMTDPKYNRTVKGQLDQVRIFNTTLTSGQAEDLYTDETTTTAATLDFPVGAGCIAAYQLDGNASDISNTYNGTPTDIGYTGLKFKSDLVWLKERSGTDRHVLMDSVREFGSQLSSDSTAAQTPYSSNITAFEANGFILGSASETNGNNEKYVSWCFKAGGAPDTDNINGAGLAPTLGSVMIDGVKSTAALAGTIAATKISANTAGGFSIVGFTSNGAASVVSTGHGLNVTPELVIWKNRNDISQWPVYHKKLGFNGRLQLEDSVAFQPFTPFFDITSTTIAIRQSSLAANNNECIAYCFHSVAGYQKVGFYTGTGQVGNTVYTTDNGLAGGANGFKPSFLMIKDSSTSGEDWLIVDNKREGASAPTKILYPSTAGAEESYIVITFTSNGFTVGITGLANGTGSTIIYLAIA